MIVLEGLERKPFLSRKIGDLARLQSPATWIAATTLLAFVIRLIVVCFAFHSIANPSNTHAEFGFEMGWTARSIALGRGFSGPFQWLTGPTALVPPLYPYLLAAIFRLFGLYTATSAFIALALNSLLSALTCIPIYAAAREVSPESEGEASPGNRTDRLARWASFGWAIYPFAIFYSAANVWDYALTALLFACCFAWSLRLHRSHGAIAWALFGVLYGFTALSNPSIVSILPFLLLIAVRRSREIGVPALRRAAAAAFTFLLVLVPWTIRNERVLHILTPLRDGFWLEFYAGNSGDPLNSNSPLAHPASNPAEMKLYAQLGEDAYMAQKHDLAIAFVRRHPRTFLLSTARRILRFWTGYWSFSPTYLQLEPLDLPNVPFCTTLTLFSLAGLVWWWRRDRAALLPFALLLAVFPLPYYLTHASMDYRSPIEPQLAILIAAGALALRERLAAPGAEPIEVPDPNLDLVPS